MKQVVFHSYGPPTAVVKCEDAEKPANPSAWEVIVRIEAFPINPADSAMIRGQYGFLNPPSTPIGMEAAGIVVEVGKSVADLKAGDSVVVLANNNWCQFRKVPATLVVKVPHEADLNQMAMLKVSGLSAWHLLTEVLSLQSGDTIVQNAPLSAVGRYVVQLANVLGIKTVNLVRRSDQIEEVRQLGGTHCFVDEDETSEIVREKIGKVPLRLALDCVGGQATERVARCLSEHGTVVNYGMMSNEPCILSPEHLIFRNIRLVGFWLSRVLNKMPASDRCRHISRLADWVCEGKLHGAIDTIYPIEQITDAVRRSEQTGRNGKVLVSPNSRVHL